MGLRDHALLHIAALVFCVLFFISNSAPAAAYSELEIILPRNLSAEFTNGEIDERPALFGAQPWGQSLTGTVVYLTPNGLFDNACSAINISALPEWPTDGPIIGAVDRGGCDFVKKVINVQATGAQACIVADNVNETYLPWMADDGDGHLVTIPSVLIPKDAFDKFRPYLNSATSDVIVRLSWGVKNPAGIVEWDLWLSSHDANSREFVIQFAEAAEILGDRTVLSPHYQILTTVPGSYCRTDPLDPCQRECLNRGRYCAYDPEDGGDGRDVIVENLRQMCLFNFLNTTGTQNLWWQYVKIFDEKCAQPNNITIPCSEDVLNVLKIPLERINDCVNSSYGSPAPPMKFEDMFSADINNTMLEDSLVFQRHLQIFKLPAVLINDEYYPGSLVCSPPLDVSTCPILSALCSGFLDDKRPPACISSPDCPLGEPRDVCGICGGGKTDKAACSPPPEVKKEESGLSTGTVVAIVLVPLVVLAIAGYFFMKRREASLQQRMQQQMESILAAYVPLENGPAATNAGHNQGGSTASKGGAAGDVEHDSLLTDDRSDD